MSDNSMTLSEVADMLGVSQRTVRRWIHQGTLQAELLPGRNGPQYFIASRDVRETAERIRRPRRVADADAIEQINSQIRELSERVKALQQRHHELRQLSTELIRASEELRLFRRDLATWREASRQTRFDGHADDQLPDNGEQRKPA